MGARTRYGELAHSKLGYSRRDRVITSDAMVRCISFFREGVAQQYMGPAMGILHSFGHCCNDAARNGSCGKWASLCVFLESDCDMHTFI
jgi:hypothetical protein